MGPSVKRATVLSGVVAAVLLGASVALVSGSDGSALSEPAAAQAAADLSGAVEQITPAEPDPAPQQTDVTLPAVNPVALTDGLSAQEAQWMLDAARWCPPLDTLPYDMEALRCWLVIGEGRIELDLKLNLGDLPAWGEIDVAAIAEQLAAYEAAAEQARAAEEQSKTPVKTTPPPPRPGVQLATTYDGLHHQCRTLRIAAACNALFDMAAAGGTPTPGTTTPNPQPEAPPQEPSVPAEYDIEATARLHDERIAELARLIAENCTSGGTGRYFHTSGQPVEYYYVCKD